MTAFISSFDCITDIKSVNEFAYGLTGDFLIGPGECHQCLIGFREAFPAQYGLQRLGNNHPVILKVAPDLFIVDNKL